MSSAAAKGSDTPAWARRGDDSASSWRSERESGAASRGAMRGRGRGGGGAPRGRQGGGRGAGGNRSVSARGALDISKSTPPPPPLPSASEKPGTGGNSVPKNSAPPPKTREFPKVPNRPNLTVDAQAAQSSDSTSPLSPSKPARRRRNTHKRSASAAIPKPIPTALTDALPASPSVPLMPSSKDVPATNDEKAATPIVHVHDLRKEITDLVHHVRNMAIDGQPTTHIDWAGEDDDSLPDLDDWGISSKLASDVGETAANVTSKPEPIAQTLPNASNESVPEKTVGKDAPVAQIVTVDGAQSSAESPTESSMSMTLSVPPPVKRTRERRRGNRRDREKRASLAAQLNGSNDKQAPLVTTTTPKKSLLERISSPVRLEPPPLPESARGPPVPDLAMSSSMSEPNFSQRGSLPPRPLGLPKKPLPPTKTLSSWRDNKGERPAPKEIGSPAQHVELVLNGPKPSEPPKQRAEGIPSSMKEAVSTDSPNEPVQPTNVTPAEPKKEATPAANTTSFDWSEEPALAPAEDGWPSVEVEPATPANDVAPVTPPIANTNITAASTTTPISHSPVPNITETKSNPSASPRFRSQRPLSGDNTPRPRRDRSPYKTHNPRNHSMPHAGAGARSGSGSSGGSAPGSRGSPTSSPLGRPHRGQHASRPILRVDALAMISRSLRESTPPPRKESPPVTKPGES